MHAPREQPARVRRRLTPIAASILIHVVLASAVVGVTLSSPERAPGSAAEFILLAPRTPPSTPFLEPAALIEPNAQASSTPAEPIAESPSEPSSETSVSSASRPREPEPGSAAREVPSPEPTATQPVEPAPAMFAGSRASGARVVYVVDLSGSMVSSLGLVLSELERSISALDDAHQFHVIFFHEQGAGVELLPGGWTTRRGADLRPVFDWLHERRPGGRSNPMDGLRAAIDLEPDAVFLLSRSIRRTGGGAWDRDAVLRELEGRNPVRDGSRRIAIKAIQFIDEDPTGTMRAIGEGHGGPDGYRVLTLDELNP